MKTELWAILLVIGAGLIGALGPIFLKKGCERINFRKISTILKNKYILGGVITFFLGTFLFIPALKGGDLSVLYPLIALSYGWVAIYSHFMLNERMKLSKLIGIFLIVVGVTIIGVSV